MAHPNKAKGDRAERAIRDYVVQFFASSWKTRAGWDDDRGDIVLDLLGDKSATYAIQSKDVASPAWGEWFIQLGNQIRNGDHRGGVIWWKLRGKSHPSDWRVVMTGGQYMALMTELASAREAANSRDKIGA